jgi:hypothetical protein
VLLLLLLLLLLVMTMMVLLLLLLLHLNDLVHLRCSLRWPTCYLHLPSLTSHFSLPNSSLPLRVVIIAIPHKKVQLV